MLLGTQPGKAYADNEGRMYYDTPDGRTFRTGRGGHGLYRWEQRGSSATWKPVRGETQWRPMPRGRFEAIMRRTYG